MPGQELPLGKPYTVKGYAYSLFPILRVEISTDLGQTWCETTIRSPTLRYDNSKIWTWTFWEHDITCEKDGMEVWVRAQDVNSNMQPLDLEDVWNFRGVMNNSV